MVDRAEPLEIAIQDVHVGVDANGQRGHGHAGNTGAQDDHLGRTARRGPRRPVPPDRPPGS